jgi:hypothetical protein
MEIITSDGVTRQVTLLPGDAFDPAPPSFKDIRLLAGRQPPAVVR